LCRRLLRATLPVVNFKAVDVLSLVGADNTHHLGRRMSNLFFHRLFGGWFFAASFLVLSSFARAQAPGPEEPAPKNFAEAIGRAGVKTVAGPATYRLGSVAELKLPAGYHAVEAGSLKRYYEITENLYGGNEVGVVIGPADWVLVFDYEDTGYVKDDEKNQLDADKLMKSMVEAGEESNKVRAEQGWAEMKMVGWAKPPGYDEKTNNLTWAVRLTSSSDGHKEVFLNESIRLLGRGGVMNVTLVTDPNAHAADSATVAGLLAKNFGYVEGQRYAEFKEGDKIAEYGLAALVLGGAGAAAFKLGFLQKFWKLLVFGGIAVAGFLGKIWNKITGKNPE
jgi:uncharacterized membrane-anchored protein